MDPDTDTEIDTEPDTGTEINISDENLAWYNPEYFGKPEGFTHGG